jgi:hypothetical protein
MKRKSIIRGFLIYLALIFVVLASGCVSIGPTTKSYSGDRLQKSEVAVIKGWSFYRLFGYDGIDIYSIDGNYLEATKVEVLPGWHELIIWNYDSCFLPWVSCDGPSYARVAFNFEAGHEYEIKGSGIDTPGFKIVDVATGAIIHTLPW